MWKKKKIKLENDTCQVRTLDDNYIFPASVCVSVLSFRSCLTLCNPVNGSPPSSPGPGFCRQNIGVGRHALLQGILLTQEWNPLLLCLLRWQSDSLPLCLLGSPLASIRHSKFFKSRDSLFHKRYSQKA